MPHGKIILMTPGPTMVDYDILLESARSTINHVSDEFDVLHRSTLDKLKTVFGTSGKVIVAPGSGTLAMELALRSVVKKGMKVLVLRAGYFGDYFAKGVKLLGGEPLIANAETGYGFTGSELDRLLEENKDIDVIAFQHVDTSTSVANPVYELAKVAKNTGVRVLVDGVASIGGMEIKMDQWGVDVCFTGSQKALGVPPGLALTAFSKEFSEEIGEETGSPSLYFNIQALLREMDSTKNYYLTPAVNLVYSLHKSLEIILNEGLENRYERHRIMAESVRRAVQALGLKLVAHEDYRSNTVTAVYLPEGVEWPSLYKGMRKRYVEIAGGLGELKGKIFRIGHMGQVGYHEIVATIGALERTLNELGYKVELGKALKAVQEILSEEDL